MKAAPIPNGALAFAVELKLERIASQLEDVAAEVRAQRAQREMLADLLGDVSHLTGPTLGAWTLRFEELERRGYLGFARSGVGIVDRVVTSFSDEDVEALGDNIVLILETLKEMTQPEVMSLLRRTAHTVNEPGTPAAPPSVFALLRELRDPEVRLGLARLLDVLRSLAHTDREGQR